METSKRVMIRLFITILLISINICQEVSIFSKDLQSRVLIINQGIINSQFLDDSNMNCSPPHLYIYLDNTHTNYQIQFVGLEPSSIQGLIYDIDYNLTKSITTTNVEINNKCPFNSKNIMNIISIQIQGYSNIRYMVNCSPQQFYKPFQVGLFLLLFLCSITITLSSLYSRAWSYGGFGININAYFVGFFNFSLILGLIIAYNFTLFASVSIKVIGSLMGCFGVMVCVTEILWLTKSVKMKKQILSKLRIIDIIGFIIGIAMMGIYWITQGNWIINDILAICTIVTFIKILKLRSLKMGMILILSILLVQIMAGLFIHYVIKQSYNNLIISLFSSPVVIVFPSITNELYRRCAWLPLTNVIFPGLLLSYLRRFDVSRSTKIYIIIGYFSYWCGSILWMIADMSTIHAWPVAIISEPVTFLIVLGVSIRRNEFKTIWQGTFYDDENPDIKQQLIRKSKKIDDQGSLGFQIQKLTEDIKIDSKANWQSSANEIQIGL